VSAELLRALALGALQGATEFLPVSSSGHLVVVPALLGWPDQDLTFDVVVHLATALAVLIYFRADWLRLLRGGWRGLQAGAPWRDPDGRLLSWILLASVPAVVVGLSFKDFFEGLFAAPRAAAAMLFVTGALILVAEAMARQARDTQSLGGGRALIVGGAQALAIMPGISRSGATIAAGMFVGLDRAEAARFSFLLAAPIIVGAAGVQLLDFFGGDPSPGDLRPLAVGFLSAFGVGYLAIGGLLAWVRRAPLYVFVAWTWLLGAYALWQLP
jgi:undecaprenyl-diphosphatase